MYIKKSKFVITKKKTKKQIFILLSVGLFVSEHKFVILRTN
jgi:hypothetical protein